MHLMIVRHGQCLGQCEPYDPSPDSQLSRLGEQQARLTAQRIAGNAWGMSDREREEREARQLSPRPSGIRDPYLVSSPLVRALATAKIISDMLGGCPVDVWTELRELYAGEHRGYGRAELQRDYPHAVLPASIADDGWLHGDVSVDAVSQRATHVISMLLARFEADDQVIMVTHGGFANALLHALFDISLATPQWFALDNCSISRVRLIAESERWGWPPFYPAVAAELTCLNDVSHLGRSEAATSKTVLRS